MRRLVPVVLVAAVAVSAALLLVRRARPESAPALSSTSAPAPTAAFEEHFSAPRLDPAKWVKTSEGDFEEQLVDLAEVTGSDPKDYRLKIRAATRGTRDDTVKFLGARTALPMLLSVGSRVSADLDWNAQSNGSYLSAALILSPLATTGNPLTGPDWIRIEYVGVPPGRNGRMVVAARTAGRERFLFMEGWPEKNRAGRPISLQTMEFVIRERGLEILENGRRVYECPDNVVLFRNAYLYLQMSTHSNYPPREVFFDRVRVQAP